MFGNEPPILAGRGKMIDDVLNGLRNAPGDPNRVTLFTGPRGSGKTVLLARIASEAESIGWISASASASPRLLDELIEQIERRAANLLPKKSVGKLTGLQVYGTGFTREISPERELTWRTRVENHLDIFDETGTGLIFVIDEISAEHASLIELISTFQAFIMAKRNVALIMAGLPNKVMQLYQHDSVSFLRRAFRRNLGPVSMPDVRAAIKKTVELTGREIEARALSAASEKTEGFPFLIQLIGYHAFNRSNRKTITLADAKAGIRDAEEDMQNMILDATMFELSSKDREYLNAMLEDEGASRTADIAARMGVSASYAGQYKRRLAKLGVITETRRGEVDFVMPMMKRYMRKQQ
ncbi:MAG: AAA family ATPase [Clostridiales Family XIII bacterium]|nr:AAA family ATPase [Clostridiales Family XIII bacterium]